MAPLPMAIQQTMEDVQRHYVTLQDQISNLQHENRELKKRLQTGGGNQASMGRQLSPVEMPGALLDVSDGEYDKISSPVAHHPLPPTTTQSRGLGKIDDEMIQAAMDNRKSRNQGRVPSKGLEVVASKSIAGNDENAPLSANKFDALKSDPFAGFEEDEEDAGFQITITTSCIAQFFYAYQTKGDWMQKITAGMCFKTLAMSAIAANTLYLAFAADYNVKNSYRRLQGLSMYEPWIIPDVVFTSWFTLEILLRMGAEKYEFWVGEDQSWNLFDLALVMESLFTVVSTAAAGGAGGGSRLSFLRIFRVFRLVRVVRVVRSVKALARLRTMIFAILNSFVDLLWAFLVVILILLVFGIVFSTPVTQFFDDVDLLNAEQMSKAELVHLLFGSMFEMMMSLWSAVSGGNDWMTYGEILRQLPSGEIYFMVFNFYIAFCVVGLFNVVTGVFVDSAVCCRTGDEVVQGYLEDLRNTTAEIKVLFKEADKDGSGTLNFEEFEQHMKTPAVKAYFSGLDIDPEEAGIIFTLLDSDKSKEILIDEFVNGTMKLKGSATKLDLMAMMYDLTKQNLKFDSLCDFMESELADIKRRLPQARTDPKGKDMPRAVAVARRL